MKNLANGSILIFTLFLFSSFSLAQTYQQPPGFDPGPFAFIDNLANPVESITFKDGLWLPGPVNLRNETHEIVGSDKKETFRCDLNTNKGAMLSAAQPYPILKNTTLKVFSVHIDSSYWFGHLSRVFWSHRVLLKFDAADNSIVDSIECRIENQHQKNIQYHFLQYILGSTIQFNYKADLTQKKD